MSLATRLSDLATAVGTDIKSLRVTIWGASGSLADLQTTAKGNLIAAINEARTTGGSGTPPNASETVAGVVELATTTEVTTGTDTTRAVTPAGLKVATDAVRTALLGGAGPAFDTLEEIRLLVEAAEETSVINALTTTVGLKADKSEIYTRTELGNPDADLVAVYTTAKA